MLECPNCKSTNLDDGGILDQYHLTCKDCGYKNDIRYFKVDEPADQLKEVQTERGNVYGSFSDHSKAVDDIMAILSQVNRSKNKSGSNPVYPIGFKTALFYIVSKLVRLATTPTHIDSALDLSSYADLWLKIIRKDVPDEKSD